MKILRVFVRHVFNSYYRIDKSNDEVIYQVSEKGNIIRGLDYKKKQYCSTNTLNKYVNCKK